MEYWAQIYFLDLWDTAIESDAIASMSSLAQRTPPALLRDAYSLALSHHHPRAIYVLLIELKRQHMLFSGRIMENIACDMACKACACVRRLLFPLMVESFDPASNKLFLADDFEFVRRQIRVNKSLNLAVMRRPIMLMLPMSDVVAEHIFKQTDRLWTIAMRAVCAKIMWSRWRNRQLHPDSSYIKRVASRCNAQFRCVVTS